ncbi:hypothetical protein DP163_gp008 [Sea otter poxvirus]|uniref:Uncharacterized protein n=1 Tax=Sea otter poxvirus TaxID=1416741 RepID=A0A2U9QHI2_9POXV|nr:hypothetical protein DP163_gp008 [Sea otter poxvirus]AWU47053.1 hypothetical protein [Sea otter poxvirus]
METVVTIQRCNLNIIHELLSNTLSSMHLFCKRGIPYGYNYCLNIDVTGSHSVHCYVPVDTPELDSYVTRVLPGAVRMSRYITYGEVRDGTITLSSVSGCMMAIMCMYNSHTPHKTRISFGTCMQHIKTHSLYITHEHNVNCIVDCYCVIITIPYIISCDPCIDINTYDNTYVYLSRIPWMNYSKDKWFQFYASKELVTSQNNLTVILVVGNLTLKLTTKLERLSNEKRPSDTTINIPQRFKVKKLLASVDGGITSRGEYTVKLYKRYSDITVTVLSGTFENINSYITRVAIASTRVLINRISKQCCGFGNRCRYIYGIIPVYEF